MKFQGFLDLSLSDFPGHAACVVYTQGCNFNCPYCHNSSLIQKTEPQNGFDSEWVLNFLKQNDMIDGVVVTGGEPTLQKQLIPFLKAVKSIDKKIKLDTNGSRPAVLKTVIKEKAADYIAMDIKAPFKKYKIASGGWHNVDIIMQSVEIILQSGINCEFRTTADRNLLTADDLLEIGKTVQGRTKYILQPVVHDNMQTEDDWLLILEDIETKINIRYGNCTVRK
jgi:pyruvate formate lyase activating enzyme